MGLLGSMQDKPTQPTGNTVYDTVWGESSQTSTYLLTTGLPPPLHDMLLVSVALCYPFDLHHMATSTVFSHDIIHDDAYFYGLAVHRLKPLSYKIQH